MFFFDKLISCHLKKSAFFLPVVRLQLLNALQPRLVTDSGSTIAVSPDPLNAPVPTLVTVFGRVTVRSAPQPAKQLSATVGRLAGSVTFAKLALPAKALAPRLVIESDSTIAVSPDPLNARSPTLVVAFGMRMVRSAVQVSKQLSGTAGRLAGSVTLTKLVHR